MTGQAHWLPVAFIALSALPIVYVWLRYRRAARRYHVEETCVRCRAKGNQLAQCTLVRDASTDQPIGIRDCSLQQGVVNCGKSCLPLFESTR